MVTERERERERERDRERVEGYNSIMSSSALAGKVVCKMCAARYGIQSKYLEQVMVI